MGNSFHDSDVTLCMLEAAQHGDLSSIDALFVRHLADVKQSVRRRLRPQSLIVRYKFRELPEKKTDAILRDKHNGTELT
jgi:hypothetical protein